MVVKMGVLKLQRGYLENFLEPFCERASWAIFGQFVGIFMGLADCWLSWNVTIFGTQMSQIGNFSTLLRYLGIVKGWELVRNCDKRGI